MDTTTVTVSLHHPEVPLPSPPDDPVSLTLGVEESSLDRCVVDSGRSTQSTPPSHEWDET